MRRLRVSVPAFSHRHFSAPASQVSRRAPPQRHATDSRWAAERRPIVLPPSELCDPHIFPAHERVLSQRMTHSTTPQNARSILEDGVVRGAKPSNGSYDGLASDARAPPLVFGLVPPESDGVVFPFSRYPRGTPSSSPISILSLSIQSLLSDEYMAFYAGTTPSQFGERFMKVYRSVVVFAKRAQREAVDFCERELVPLDKRQNRLLFADESNEFSTATRFAAPESEEATAATPSLHHVVVAIATEIDFSSSRESWDAQLMEGTRLRYENGRFHCPYASCDYTVNSLAYLKTHYRARHTDVKPMACEFPSCDYTSASAQNLAQHQRVHSDEEPYACHMPGCSFRSAHSVTLKEHSRIHTGFRHLFCDHDGCSFATSDRGNLLVHQRIHAGHKPFVCSAPGCHYASTRKYNLKIHQQTH